MLREYISRFTRAALTITDFHDQTGRSVFISNIHRMKQYKYLIGHQNIQYFTTLMDVVASHALTEEKISPFTNLITPTIWLPYPPITHNSDRPNQSDGGHYSGRVPDRGHVSH